MLWLLLTLPAAGMLVGQVPRPAVAGRNGGRVGLRWRCASRRGRRPSAWWVGLLTMAVICTVAAIHLMEFDSCLGFPGEGPVPAETEVLTIGTANVTAWSSFLGAKLWGEHAGAGAAIWAIQETKLDKKGAAAADRLADGRGWGLAHELARSTPAKGKSAGVAVTWDRMVCGSSANTAVMRSGCSRWVCRELAVGGTSRWRVSTATATTPSTPRSC